MEKRDKLTLTFKDIYVAYYSQMKRFAETYVMSEPDAENIVQDVFFDLWERQDTLDGCFNKAGWLLTSVKNKCVDFLRHKIVEQKSAAYLQEEHVRMLQMKFDSLEAFDEGSFMEDEIESVVTKAVQTLPDKCREIFVKSKIEGMKQKEIAEELGISVNSIETQMGIAYKKLKTELIKLLPVFIFLLIGNYFFE